MAYAEDFPDAFARVQLSVKSTGRLSDDMVRRFADAFGCPVKVVYRRV